LELLSKKSILIIAPSLIAESLSLKLTSLDKNLDITLNSGIEGKTPDLIIWNILNFQSEDLIRLELLKLRERWAESKILIILSGELVAQKSPSLNAEGFLLNPSVDNVLESINIILNGGRVFDLENNSNVKNKKEKLLTFNQKLLTSGLKQIDNEINYIFKYVNSDSTPDFYKFILKGRLRELITAKSFLIFIWGNSLDLYTEALYTENKITFDNKKIEKYGPQKRRDLSISFVPENRLGHSAVPELSLSENILLSQFPKNNFIKNGIILKNNVDDFANNVINEFKVITPGNDAKASSLSGGNLQKLIIGRELITSPDLLICFNPTWGLDVGAINYIHETLIKINEQNKSIILISTDTDELLKLSDKISVIHRGKLSKIMNAEDVTSEKLGILMGGGN